MCVCVYIVFFDCDYPLYVNDFLMDLLLHSIYRLWPLSLLYDVIYLLNIVSVFVSSTMPNMYVNSVHYAIIRTHVRRENMQLAVRFKLLTA